MGVVRNIPNKETTSEPVDKNQDKIITLLPNEAQVMLEIVGRAQ